MSVSLFFVQCICLFVCLLVKVFVCLSVGQCICLSFGKCSTCATFNATAPLVRTEKVAHVAVARTKKVARAQHWYFVGLLTSVLAVFYQCICLTVCRSANVSVFLFAGHVYFSFLGRPWPAYLSVLSFVRPCIFLSCVFVFIFVCWPWPAYLSVMSFVRPCICSSVRLLTVIFVRCSR